MADIIQCGPILLKSLVFLNGHTFKKKHKINKNK